MAEHPDEDPGCQIHQEFVDDAEAPGEKSRPEGQPTASVQDMNLGCQVWEEFIEENTMPAGHGSRDQDGEAPGTTSASAADVLEILNKHAAEVLGRLALSPLEARLSMPLDDRGPRIKVSVRPGAILRLPLLLSFRVSGRTVRVPLEKAEDYQTSSRQ